MRVVLDDSSIKLRNSIQQLKELNFEEIPDDISPEEFDSLDDSEVTTEPVLSDDLSTDMMGKGADENVESDDGDENADADVAIEKPITVAVRNAVKTLMNCSLFSPLDKIRSSTVKIKSLLKKISYRFRLRTYCESKN